MLVMREWSFISEVRGGEHIDPERETIQVVFRPWEGARIEFILELQTLIFNLSLLPNYRLFICKHSELLVYYLVYML